MKTVKWQLIVICISTYNVNRQCKSKELSNWLNVCIPVTSSAPTQFVATNVVNKVRSTNIDQKMFDATTVHAWSNSFRNCSAFPIYAPKMMMLSVPNETFTARQRKVTTPSALWKWWSTSEGVTNCCIVKAVELTKKGFENTYRHLPQYNMMSVRGMNPPLGWANVKLFPQDCLV